MTRPLSPWAGVDDAEFWRHIDRQNLHLQRCPQCLSLRYPPAPICPDCLCERTEWRPVKGVGTIVSWVVFHRTYLPTYPAPYNVIAVRLAEGPLMMSNLEGQTPCGNWIGTKVKLVYSTGPDGFMLPRFRVAAQEKPVVSV